MEDIRLRIERIDTILEGHRSFGEFQDNIMMHDAIERNLTVIGEAVKRILDKDATIPISHARDIVGLRNRIMHTYDKIEDTELWKILINDLPHLRKEVEQLLNNE